MLHTQDGELADARRRATELVSRLTGADAQPTSTAASAEELMSLVYDELHRLAAHYMGGERREHTLQPTALVNEAYLRLVDSSQVDFRGRRHFVAVSAQAMRRILIDHARARARVKRGGGWDRVTLAQTVAEDNQGDLDREQLLSLNGAIDRLSKLDARQARIVELRFFGGMTVAEIADVLEVSKRTVGGDWAHARAWLKRELASGNEP